MATAESCVICHRNTADSMELGRLYKRRTGLSAHYHCLVFSTFIHQRGSPNKGIKGFLETDIKDMLDTVKSKKCMFCKLDNANIKCCHPSGCNQVFHLPCGLERDALHQFYDNFQSYCPKHRLRQEVVVSAVLPELCSICLQGWSRKRKLSSPFKTAVSEKEKSCRREDEVLWAPCCKFTTAFHRECVKRMAETSGYFFKCPCCCNKELFTKAMQTLGIYVPQEDPAWQLEREAYEEMTQTPKLLCCAEPCLCTSGPEYHRKNTLWEMAKCVLCASEAIHKRCGNLENALDNWQCHSCSLVVAPGEYNAMDTSISTRQATEGTKRKSLDMPSTSRVTTLPRSTVKRRRSVSLKSPQERTTVTRASLTRSEVPETSSTCSVGEDEPKTPLGKLLCSAVFKVGVNGVREMHSQMFGVLARAETFDDEPWL